MLWISLLFVTERREVFYCFDDQIPIFFRYLVARHFVDNVQQLVNERGGSNEIA